jgi:hypothetical protein
VQERQALQLQELQAQLAFLSELAILELQEAPSLLLVEQSQQASL